MPLFELTKIIYREQEGLFVCLNLPTLDSAPCHYILTPQDTPRRVTRPRKKGGFPARRIGEVGG